MKLLKSVIAAAVVANPAVENSPARTALLAGCPNTKPNASEKGCVSDDVCNNLPGHRIFNHFYYSPDSSEYILVPECRKTDAEVTAGFTCGTDTQLKHGSEVVIPNPPESNGRSVKLLKSTKYKTGNFKNALESNCEDQSVRTCETVNHFEDGCESNLTMADGFTIFKDFFTVAECEAEKNEYHEGDGWIEEYKIFVGYDDVVENFLGREVITAVHKVSFRFKFE